MDEGSECIISSAATPQYSEAAKNMQAKWAVPTQAWESWPIRAELAFGKGGEPNLSVQTEGEYRCSAY